MSEDLKSILKTTAKYISILEINDIKTVKDFLMYFPKGYEDRRKFHHLNELEYDGTTSYMIKGRCIDKKIYGGGPVKKRMEIIFQDTLGNQATLYFFSFIYVQKIIEIGQETIIIGKPKFTKNKIIFTQPDIIPMKPGYENDPRMGTIYPIYSEMLGVHSTRFTSKVWLVKDKIQSLFPEFYPTEFLKQFHLMDIATAVQEIHFPTTFERKEQAWQRIFFDKLLKIQLSGYLHKDDYQNTQQLTPTLQDYQRDILKDITQKLSFELTIAQKKVLKHMVEDFHKNKPMMRLLQGDVGSGKTIVTILAAYYTHKVFGGQTALLAPLEVLATQHYKTIAQILLPLGIRVEYLTGSLTKKQKTTIKEQMNSGDIHIVVGTHALLQEDISFKKLSYVIIDEQHKFGVKQRAFFKRFGSPHIIQMSATPIPRSLAMAYFSEFDVSVIDQMPLGRKPIITKIISTTERKKLKQRVLTKIGQGQKVFVVTPLIEESESLDDVQSALQTYEDMKNIYPELKGEIGLLHGKLKPAEKEEIMNKFKKGEYVILVSTTVIEVGVDIREASIIAILNAERFGLAQLHQLRGRVGRSDIQSYCFLLTKNKSGDSYQRLRSLEETTDGFKLAELDLKFRGAGEFLGTRQSGDTDLPLEIVGNIQFVENVQQAAKRLINFYEQKGSLEDLKKIFNIQTNHFFL